MAKNKIKNDNYNYQLKCFEQLNNRWNFLDKIRIQIANNFDKYLLTFSTGSLYLSILFTNNLRLTNSLSHKQLLGAGWLLLLISIFFALLSIYFSVFAYKTQMNITKKQIDNIGQADKFCEPMNCWNIIIYIFQAFSVITFFSGITLLSVFYYLNI